MGQKVSATSFRLQVSKDWSSRWFSGKRHYQQLLMQDLTVRRLIQSNVGMRGAVSRVTIERSPGLATVTIATGKAGVVIGRGGSGADSLKKACESILKTAVRLNIEEVKKPELHAKLIAENIAQQLERRIAFRRALKQAAAAAMRSGARGVRIEISGRLGGNEMSRREKLVEGSVPLHTLRSNIDFHKARAMYPGAGIIGIKVWVYAGDNS